MTKDRKKNRLKNYDYSGKGYYYVTICVHPVFKGQNIFGIINNYNEMVLKKYGETVQIINIGENVGNGNVCVGNGLKPKPFPTFQHIQDILRS